ncbi:MAG: helix-turn-helix domain-containing protein [Bacteroidota bacterium]
MGQTTIHIKHMCCSRCIATVTQELVALGLEVNSVKLGEAIYTESSKVKTDLIGNKLKAHGFEIITGGEEQLVELIKTTIIELIHHSETLQGLSYSEYLVKKIRKPYRYLSRIFSTHKKTTIEKYIILQKIERAKELIEYGELTFSEIAYQLGYKNLQHLSTRFKAVTGISMTSYKEGKNENRKFIDEI